VPQKVAAVRPEPQKWQHWQQVQHPKQQPWQAAWDGQSQHG
jgi:hypothetical protein